MSGKYDREQKLIYTIDDEHYARFVRILCLRPQSDTLNYSPIFYSTAIRLRTLHLVPSIYISINFF